MKSLKLLTAILALGLMFGACKKDDETNADSSKSGAAKGCVVVWNGEVDKKVAVNIDDVPSARTNASGEKIPSNAHSAKYPGIYFIWDAKQKDNGYLKVAGCVFNKWESFVLTSKEGNKYFDFHIEVQPGQQMTADGGYVFFIPRALNNKNINMVFLEGFVEKDLTELSCEELDALRAELHPILDEELYDAITARMVGLGCEEDGETACVKNPSTGECLCIDDITFETYVCNDDNDCLSLDVNGYYVHANTGQVIQAWNDITSKWENAHSDNIYVFFHKRTGDLLYVQRINEVPLNGYGRLPGGYGEGYPVINWHSDWLWNMPFEGIGNSYTQTFGKRTYNTLWGIDYDNEVSNGEWEYTNACGEKVNARGFYLANWEGHVTFINTNEHGGGWNGDNPHANKQITRSLHLKPSVRPWIDDNDKAAHGFN